MRDLTKLNEFRIPHPVNGDLGDAFNGVFQLYLNGSNLLFCVIASNSGGWGGGWDHVSVSTDCRCPKWSEMCQVKELFFKDDEYAIQYHPEKGDDLHPFCLHLWRPHSKRKIPIPDVAEGISGAASG